MSREPWQEQIVGDRMQVDQEFAPRVREAGLSNQEWGLIMTAVELRLEGEGDSAQLVADTSDVEHILPELGRIRSQQQAGGGMGGSSGGILDSIKSSLGLGGQGVDRETRETAERLAQEYATTLQTHLVENGKWSQIVESSDQPSPE